jgi:hypothetical protein
MTVAGKSLIERLRTSGGPSHLLLELLDKHRVMTTGQLSRATGTPERTVRYRMEQLRVAGLVDCARPGQESGSTPRHWWLRAAGARLVSGVALASGSPSAMFVRHAASIAEVWLALVEHGPASAVRLTGWAADRAGWQQWEPPSGRGLDRRLTPDATAAADVDAGPAAFFVEVDLATMTQSQLKLKVERYLTYADDVAWSGVHPHCPPLLLLTTTPARAANFIRAATRLLHSTRRAAARPVTGDAVSEHATRLVVAACGLVRDPARAVTEPVWLVAEPGTAEVTLAELLGERVRAQAEAHAAWQAGAAERQREEQAALLWRAVVREHKTTRAALGHRAAAVARRVYDDGAMLDAQPRLAQALLAWWEQRTPRTAAAAVAAAEPLHWQQWARHARAVLGADAHIAVDEPHLYGMARRLLAGDLLEHWDLSALDREPSDDRDEHRGLLARYDEQADAAVAAQISRMPWRARRRADPVALRSAYDEQHLLVCATCLTRYPRQRPALAGWRPPQACVWCTGALVAWTTEHDTTARPVLPGLLDQVRARLTELPDQPGG